MELHRDALDHTEDIRVISAEKARLSERLASERETTGRLTSDLVGVRDSLRMRTAQYYESAERNTRHWLRRGSTGGTGKRNQGTTMVP